MATNANAWQQIEAGVQVLEDAIQDSFIDAYGNVTPMNTGEKSVPRSALSKTKVIPKGGLYTANDTELGNVTLKLRKFGSKDDYEDEDVADTNTLPTLLENGVRAWLNSYFVELNNAVLGVTTKSLSNDTNQTVAPYNSIYASVRADDDSVGYDADDNYSSVTGKLTYDAMIDGVLAPLRRQSRWVNMRRVVIAADPEIQTYLEGVKDDQGRPIFQTGDLSVGRPDLFLGRPVIWTPGARTSAAVTDQPEGNPLIVAVDSQWLLYGRGLGPQTQYIPASINRDSDTATQKYRSRRAFALGNPCGASVLEVKPAA